MRAIKNISGHIFFVYAMLMFIATMLVIIIPVWLVSLLPEPKRARALHPIFRLWMGVYMPLVFSPVIRRGKKNFKNGENYVVVLNHNSFADIPVSSPWIPGPNKTLAKSEIGKVPLFGLIYKTGAILVDRKRPESRRESFTKMQDMLSKGVHLCLYPEGTRNKIPGTLQPFYDGAFITAVKAQKPIIPGLLFNTGKMLPNDKKLWARPMPVHIHFLAPVATRGLTIDDVPGLKENIRQQMEQYYLTNLNGKA